MEELFALPQIVSARTDARPATGPAALFGTLTDSMVELEPEEAELAKLFTNTWRYIKFAAANQFYMMANDHGLDFDRIRTALAHDYPRAADMPGAGFAAGPCLFKDTMQLAAFTDNNFALGHAAMLVNEGLPLYLVSHLEKHLRPADQDGRHPRHGVQGRERRHPVQPVLQAQADPGVPRRARCSAPTRTSPSTTTLMPLEEVLERSRHPHHRPRRTRCTATWRPTSRSPTSGTSWARAAPCEPGCLRRHPRLPGGRRDHPCPGPALRRGGARVRGARRRRLPGGHHRPGRSRRTPRRSRGSPRWSTPTAAGPRTRSATASTTPSTPPSWSPWPTAATTRGRSTTWRGSSTAASWSRPRRATPPAASRSADRWSRA